MGVRGLFTYVTENQLLADHRLADTILVIDGPNLQHGLYSRFLRTHDDRAFGGDYTHLAVYIGAFFDALLECGVTPVVIMDGSFRPDKLVKKLERFDQAITTAYQIYQGCRTEGEMISSVMNGHVFKQVCFMKILDSGI